MILAGTLGNTVHIFKSMLKKKFDRVFVHQGVLIFENEKIQFMFYHQPDCCEYVEIDDIVGNLSDLENSPLLIAEEISYIKPRS